MADSWIDNDEPDKSIGSGEDTIDTVSLVSIISCCRTPEKMVMKKRVTKKCLTSEEIALFVDGNAGEGEHARIIEHLAQCRECRTIILEVKREVSETQEDPLAETASSRIFRSARGGTRGGSPFSRSLIGRYALPLAVAASLIVASLALFFNLRQPSLQEGIDKFALTVNQSAASRMMEKEVLAARPDSMGSLHMGQSLAQGHVELFSALPGGTMKNVMLFRCGYLYFYLNHSGEESGILWRKFTGTMSAAVDEPMGYIQYIENRDTDSLGRAFQQMPEDKLSYVKAGYLLGYLMYMDFIGTVNADLLLSGKEALSPLGSPVISDYLALLERKDREKAASARKEIQAAIMSLEAVE
jgi:hypothetical protein